MPIDTCLLTLAHPPWGAGEPQGSALAADPVP